MQLLAPTTPEHVTGRTSAPGDELAGVAATAVRAMGWRPGQLCAARGATGQGGAGRVRRLRRKRHGPRPARHHPGTLPVPGRRGGGRRPR